LRLQLDLGKHGATNCAPAFSPNGRMLATAGTDGSIQLWEAATAKERRLLQGHGGRIRALAFAPNSKSLASGSDDTTSLVWQVYAAPRNGKPQSLDRLWTILASDDAAAAFTALTTLIQMPNETVTYLNGRLAPIRALDAKRID